MIATTTPAIAARTISNAYAGALSGMRKLLDRRRSMAFPWLYDKGLNREGIRLIA
jgi:hypothetical protein